jgi:ABC-type multidrug transport system fused ATPase/permease subunit
MISDEPNNDFYSAGSAQQSDVPSWQEADYNESLPQTEQKETPQDDGESPLDRSAPLGEEEIDRQIEADSAGDRVGIMDPDFIMILVFAVFVDFLDIITELTSFLLIPKLIGIVIDIFVLAVIGGWMQKRNRRLDDSKKAAQAAIAGNIQKQIKNLERLKKIGRIDQKVFERYTRRYGQKMGKIGTSLVKASRTPTGKTMIKSSLAFLGEILPLIGLMPFWTISVLLMLREK